VAVPDLEQKQVWELFFRSAGNQTAERGADRSWGICGGFGDLGVVIVRIGCQYLYNWLGESSGMLVVPGLVGREVGLSRDWVLQNQKWAAAHFTIGGCAVSIRGSTALFDGRHLCRNRIHWFGQFRLFGLVGSFAGLTWPDVETAMAIISDLPRAPNPFAFAKPTIENVMRSDVSLGPVAFKAGGIETALDEKAANVIQAITADRTIGEREVELHSVPVASWTIIVKATPRP
jgi:hypothetical protein